MASMSRSSTNRSDPGTIYPHARSWDAYVGVKFGRLKTVGFTGAVTKFGQRKMMCQCDCGMYVDVMLSFLKSGNTTSCGCAHSEMVAARNVAGVTHGAARNYTITPLYRVWGGIKSRCCSRTHEFYADYGGRGIKMHPAWRDSFEAFSDYVNGTLGARPDRSFSLDRINNDGHYEPGNLRWATSTEQNRNRRITKLYELSGEQKPLAEWADLAGLNYETVKNRVGVYKWSLDEALGTPPGSGRCPLGERRKWSGRSR